MPFTPTCSLMAIFRKAKQKWMRLKAAGTILCASLEQQCRRCIHRGILYLLESLALTMTPSMSQRTTSRLHSALRLNKTPMSHPLTIIVYHRRSESAIISLLQLMGRRTVRMNHMLPAFKSLPSRRVLHLEHHRLTLREGVSRSLAQMKLRIFLRVGANLLHRRTAHMLQLPQGLVEQKQSAAHGKKALLVRNPRNLGYRLQRHPLAQPTIRIVQVHLASSRASKGRHLLGLCQSVPPLTVQQGALPTQLLPRYRRIQPLPSHIAMARHIPRLPQTRTRLLSTYDERRARHRTTEITRPAITTRRKTRLLIQPQIILKR